MTDRELLEMAAKAVGVELWHEDIFTNGLTQKVSSNGVLCWNPFTDDGDALRLAVHAERFLMADFWPRVIALRGTLDFLGSPAESTRRAIVLVVAEIGREAK